MKVEFADTFGKSLKRLIWHEGRIYKFYSIFRYGIWHFFANIWRFRKVLWNHQWWDYRYHLEAMYTSLSIMEKGMHAGMEVRESRDKKIQKMQRALKLMKNKIAVENKLKIMKHTNNKIVKDFKYTFFQLNNREAMDSEIVDNLKEKIEFSTLQRIIHEQKGDADSMSLIMPREVV